MADVYTFHTKIKEKEGVKISVAHGNNRLRVLAHAQTVKHEHVTVTQEYKLCIVQAQRSSRERGKEDGLLLE